MDIVGKFEKISYEQFKKDLEANYQINNEKDIKEIYNNISIPQRSTNGSAGYDIIFPWAKLQYNGYNNYIPIVPSGYLSGKSSLVVLTGLKCKIEDGWFLDIRPRSGSGFKYGIRLANTTGIIDSDYYNNPNNEGHIMIKLVHDGSVVLDVFKLEIGKAFAQGIFLPYGITEDDHLQEKQTRSGGFGSTS